eukprot:100189_1
MDTVDEKKTDYIKYWTCNICNMKNHPEQEICFQCKYDPSTDISNKNNALEFELIVDNPNNPMNNNGNCSICQFIYNDHSDWKSLTTKKLPLLFLGYASQLNTSNNKIIELIKAFVGKQYVIHQSAAPQKYFDYILKLKNPIEQIGIQYEHNTITYVLTEFAKHNVIAGSRIEQINGVSIADDIEYEYLNNLIEDAKHNTPSYIIFRCNRQLMTNGVHLQYNVNLAPQHKSRKFPYFKFSKAILYNVLCDDQNDINIYQVYGDKFRGGLSILMFEARPTQYTVEELNQKDLEIQRKIQEKISNHLIVVRKQNMFGRKADILECFSNPLYQHIFVENALVKIIYLLRVIKGIDNGKHAWYLHLCDPDKLKQKSNIPLTEYGTIIDSGFGLEPSKVMKDNCTALFSFFLDPDEKDVSCWRCSTCNTDNELELTMQKYRMSCCACSSMYDNAYKRFYSASWNICPHGKQLETMKCQQCDLQRNRGFNRYWETLCFGKLSIDDKKKTIKLLLKIFNNIIQQPNEVKFRDLNIDKLKSKIKSIEPCIEILKTTGLVSNGYR